MRNVSSILAVLEDLTDVGGFLAKSSKLLGDATKINVIKIVYEGVADIETKRIDMSALKKMVVDAEQTRLTNAVKASSYGYSADIIWHRIPWQGAIEQADKVGAGLIVKQSGREDERRFSLQIPDDWNLLRFSTVPVLLAHAEPWPQNPVVIAAIDSFDAAHDPLNQRILEYARALCEATAGSLHIVTTFPPLTDWLDRFTVSENYTGIRSDIETDVFEYIEGLTKNLGIAHYQPHALEGLAAPTVARLASKEGASVTVLGTRGRKGVEGMLMGNTAEKLLQSVATDVLTVPSLS